MGPSSFPCLGRPKLNLSGPLTCPFFEPRRCLQLCFLKCLFVTHIQNHPLRYTVLLCDATTVKMQNVCHPPPPSSGLLQHPPPGPGSLWSTFCPRSCAVSRL